MAGNLAHADVIYSCGNTNQVRVTDRQLLSTRASLCPICYVQQEEAKVHNVSLSQADTTHGRSRMEQGTFNELVTGYRNMLEVRKCRQEVLFQ